MTLRAENMGLAVRDVADNGGAFYLIDWSDPENRIRRHQQKVCNYIRTNLSRDNWRQWWAAFCDDDDDALALFETVSQMFRDEAEARATQKIAEEVTASGAGANKMAEGQYARRYWGEIFST